MISDTTHLCSNLAFVGFSLDGEPIKGCHAPSLVIGFFRSLRSLTGGCIAVVETSPRICKHILRLDVQRQNSKYHHKNSFMSYSQLEGSEEVYIWSPQHRNHTWPLLALVMISCKAFSMSPSAVCASWCPALAAACHRATAPAASCCPASGKLPSPRQSIDPSSCMASGFFHMLEAKRNHLRASVGLMASQGKSCVETMATMMRKRQT